MKHGMKSVPRVGTTRNIFCR